MSLWLTFTQNACIRLCILQRKFFLNLPEDCKYCRDLVIQFMIFHSFIHFFVQDKYEIQLVGHYLTWQFRKALKHNLHKVYLILKGTEKVTHEFCFQKQLNQLRQIDGKKWQSFAKTTILILSEQPAKTSLSDIDTQWCYFKKNFKNDKIINDLLLWFHNKPPHHTGLTGRELTMILKKQNLAVLKMTQKTTNSGFLSPASMGLILVFFTIILIKTSYQKSKTRVG